MATTSLAGTTYLSCAETAKLVRKALAEAFPGVKFSVRSDTYSMGASIRVHWTDGPRSKEVEGVTRRFHGSDFDGSIDLKSSRQHWLEPDGTITLAHVTGTQGSLGYIPSADYAAPSKGAIRVHLGADGVSLSRDVTDFDGWRLKAEAMIRERCRCDGEPPNDKFGVDWVENLARAMAWDRGGDESLEAAFKRVVLRN